MVEQGSVGFEFCVSCGEGTLLDYGTTKDRDSVIGEAVKSWAIKGYSPNGLIPTDFDLMDWFSDKVISFRPASPDCPTAQ